MNKNKIYDYWKNPNDVVVRDFANAFDIFFYKTEEELKDLFKEPLSKETVEKRVDKLDAVYHTGLKRNLGSQYKQVCKSIFEKGNDFEERIKNGDEETVNELARIGVNFNLFVFASKYCSFLRPDYYPIYDSFVVKVLNWFQYRSGNPFCEEKYIKLEAKKQQYEYKKYKNIIDDFIKHYSLNCLYKELDKYLWLVGKNIL